MLKLHAGPEEFNDPILSDDAYDLILFLKLKRAGETLRRPCGAALEELAWIRAQKTAAIIPGAAQLRITTNVYSRVIGYSKVKSKRGGYTCVLHPNRRPDMKYVQVHSCDQVFRYGFTPEQSTLSISCIRLDRDLLAVSGDTFDYLKEQNLLEGKGGFSDLITAMKGCGTPPTWAERLVNAQWTLPAA